MSKPKVVKIGVFIPTESQFLDAACIDVLGMMSREYLSLVAVPAHVAAAAPSVAISYVTLPGNSMLKLTSNLTVVPTHDTTHPDVQPGRLDILFVPGPDPATRFPAEATAFVRAHFGSPGVDVLCVCTGIYLCGQAGILDGRTACGPRGLQADIKKKFPGVTLVGEK